MVFKIRLSDLAEDNLADILNYLAENWSNEVVFAFANRLDTHLSNIKATPHNFPIHSEEMKVRRCSLNPYHGIFYRIDGDIIHVITIFDLRQNPQKLKSILDE